MRLRSITLFRPTVVRNGKPTKSAVWRMKWKNPHTGKVETESTGAKSRVVAEKVKLAKQMQFLNRVPEDPYAKHRTLTWHDFKNELLNIYAAKQREATEHAFYYCIKAFTETVQPKLLWDVDRRMLEEFVTK